MIPEQAAVSGAWSAFEENGDLKDEGRRTAVEKVGTALAQTLAKLHA